MPRYEYKVVPAPKKAGKVRGIKTTEARFAHALAELMNQYGADGWEYQRTDTLPCEERSGLTGRSTSFQNMLVFRRELEPADARVPTADAIASVHMAPPIAEPAPEPATEPDWAPEPEPVRATEPAPRPVAVPEPEPEHEPQPEREEVAVLPSFRSAAHQSAEPTFSTRSQEGRTPPLGAARRQDGAGKPTLVTR